MHSGLKPFKGEPYGSPLFLGGETIYAGLGNVARKVERGVDRGFKPPGYGESGPRMGLRLAAKIYAGIQGYAGCGGSSVGFAGTIMRGGSRGSVFQTGLPF